MTNLGLQGWSADPFGLHEQRYFSAGRPTKLVRDGQVEGNDEPPAAGFQPPASSYQPPASTYQLPASSYRPAVNGELPEPVYLPGNDTHRSRLHWQNQSRGYLRLAAFVLVATAVAVGIVVLTGSHRTSPPAVSLSAFVNRAATQTLAERTADMTITGTVQGAGANTLVSGTGQADFGADAMSLDLRFSVSGRAMTEREILAGGRLYLTIGPASAQSPTWMQARVPQSDSADQVDSDPVATLSLLKRQGIAVRTLGTKIVGGADCTGYLVSSGPVTGLPLGVTVTVWIDSRDLMRELSVGVQTAAPGDSASANVIIDFSDFGAPVQIVAPAHAVTS